MKNLLQNLLQSTTNLLQYRFTKPLYCPEQMPIPIPVIEKTAGERLYEFSMQYYNTDPTPKDEQPDEYACVHSITTILDKYFSGYPIMTYTPTMLEYIKKDSRFKPSVEFKTGNIIISPTKSGAGRVVGHVGIIGKDGKILSNSSSNGLWFDKYNTLSWIDRYSRFGGLDMYIFELV